MLVPLYELSARMEPTGGDIASNVLPPLLVGPHLTILIHGFNNSQDQASQSFMRFLRTTELRQHPHLSGQVCVFYWPGDHGWYRYHTEIERAQKAAGVLRDYVQQISGGLPLEVSLICHSLGNRLALEFITQCLATPGLDVTVPRACLMAAAVPV